MDPAIDELINSINFDLDPIFIIRLDGKDKDWYLENVDFALGDNLTRTVTWTAVAKDALRFSEVDEAHDFIIGHLGLRKVSIVEKVF